MNNERATPNYEFMTDSQEIKFPFYNKCQKIIEYEGKCLPEDRICDN